MATLTEKRLTQAKPVLESNRKRLHESGKIDARQFEKELREVWDVKYLTFRTIIIDMAKNHSRYKYLVAYYIENENPNGVGAHYRSALAKLYGMRRLADPEREKKKAAFWKRIGKNATTEKDGPTHKITAKLDGARSLIEQYPGEVARHIVKIDCKLIGNGIDVSTTIRIEQDAEADDDDVKAVATLVRNELPSYFCKQRDLFGVQTISVSGKLPKARDYTKEIEFEVSDELFNSLKLQSAHNTKAGQSFTNAVRRLRSIAQSGLGSIQGNWSEVVSLLVYIDRSLEVAELGHMYGWYKDKQGGVRTYFHDLHKRKQASHPHFKLGQEYILDTLSGFSPPTQWSQRPPVMSVS